VLVVYAVLCYVAGILSLIICVVRAITDAKESSSGAEVVIFLTYGIAAMVAGGLFHGLSAACSALRDIARNSFGFSRVPIAPT
jgi:hypothetical protein